MRQRSRASYKRNRKKRIARQWTYKLKTWYGLTVGQYDKLKQEHKGRCALCRKKSKLQIDHSHASGKVRGLLCFQCNSALGLLKDSVKTLKRTIDYLKKGRP